MEEQDVRQVGENLVDQPIQTITPLNAGTNSVYEVILRDNTKRVIKFGTFTQRASFRAEPLVQSFVKNQTTLPVPKVVAKSMEEDPPCFVMTHVSGDAPDTKLSFSRMKRIVQEAGRFLGELHRIKLDVNHSGELHAKEGANYWHVEREETWKNQLVRTLGNVLEDSEPQFSDTAELIKQLYESHSDRIPLLEEYSLIHGDYRFGNLIVDENGSLNAVLDWGQALAGDPLYNTARTLYLIERDYEKMPSHAHKLTDEFISGYEQERKFRLDERMPSWEMYTLHTIAVELRWFSKWYSQWSKERRAVRAASIRRRVQTAAGRLQREK